MPSLLTNIYWIPQSDVFLNTVPSHRLKTLCFQSLGFLLLSLGKISIFLQNSWAVQWLGLRAGSELPADPGSIPGGGKLKILQAMAKKKELKILREQ